jgi:antitoxin VapB
MSIYIKDPATDKAVRKLAKLRGQTLTEAIKFAVEYELEKEKRHKKLSLAERIRPLQERFAALPKSGLQADKAFYDSLSGEE